MTSFASCPVCGGDNLTQSFRTPLLPIMCAQLHSSPETARRIARAAIDLVGCNCCGHLFNATFDPTLVDYQGIYENSLMGSPRYREFTVSLIERLFSSYRLEGGTVLEIGCGRGEFLRMLCERGMLRAVGCDPSCRSETATIGAAELTIIGDPFDPMFAPHRVDLVCARHVLEHLANPVPFLASVRKACSASPDYLLFLEVPNGRHMTERFGIWDLAYEHVSYFTQSSLRRAMTMAGFAPDRIETAFGGQYLLAQARPAMPEARPAIDEIREAAAQFEAFRECFGSALDVWSRWLQAIKQSGRRVALWGAGAKTVTFLNLLDRCENHAIGTVIDINPLKSDTYVAGTGHSVTPPSVLCQTRPELVLLMNPEYEAEVRSMIESFRITAQLVAISDGNLPAALRRV